MKSRKALSAVVSLGLLVVVSVLSVAYFNNWFDSYQSGVLSDVESRNDVVSGGVRLDGIVGDSMYVYSGEKQIIRYFKIEDTLGNEMCEFSKDNNHYFNSTRVLINFDDENATDISGYNNSGKKYYGVDCSVMGKSNKGCYFDGIDDFINISQDTSSWDLYPGIKVISVWIYYPIITGSRYAIQQTYGGTNQGNYLIVSNSHFTATYASDTSAKTCSYPEGLLNFQGKWNHVVMVQKRAQDNQSFIKTYLNGELICNIDNYSVNWHLGPPQNSALQLGGRAFNDDLYWQGYIDELSVYVSELSDDEVKLLYDSGKALMYEQLLPKGIKEYNVSSCNLLSGEEYDVVMITDKTTYSSEVIAK